MDEAGRFLRNLARTTPTLPCALMTCEAVVAQSETWPGTHELCDAKVTPVLLNPQ